MRISDWSSDVCSSDLFRFPGIEGDGAHGIARFLRPVEAVQDFVSAFHDVGGYVALVGNAHVRHGVAADKAIAANEAEHPGQHRSEGHTSELQSLMRNSYAVFCLKTKTHNIPTIAEQK